MWSARPLTVEKYASPCGNGEKSNNPILENKLIVAKIVEWINAFCSMGQKNNRVHVVRTAERTPALFRDS
jgi:hypothetical protein